MMKHVCRPSEGSGRCVGFAKLGQFQPRLWEFVRMFFAFDIDRREGTVVLRGNCVSRMIK